MPYIQLEKATIDGVDWELTKLVTTKYFKNGKPNLHCEVTYSVSIVDQSIVQEGSPINLKQRFWMKNKSEATKYFKALLKEALTVERTGINALNRIFG
jgi:hypothetical protein